MKRSSIFTVIILCFFSFQSCESEKELNQEIVSHEGEKILVGKVDLLGMSVEPYNVWFEENYRNYLVDSSALENTDIDNVEILLFLGTWCSDSQLQVPQFIKILNYLKFDLSDLTMTGLDNHPERDLTSPQHEEEGQNITFVPTFIFMQNGEEIGRIVEYPEISLEKDMAAILNNN